jgi:FtsZ-binding cell division protein ZapB
MALKEFDKLEEFINKLIAKNEALAKENKKLYEERRILKEKIKNILKNIETAQSLTTSKSKK